MHILEIQNGKYKGRRVRITEQPTVVGRDEGVKVRIASEEVSRQHCSLRATADGVLVEDLQSSNGTFVDGRPIRSETLLEPGGTLAVGPMTFKLLGESRQPVKTTPMKAPKGGSPDASVLDDDIASWLSEEASTSDTTIIQTVGERVHSGDTSVEIPVSNFDIPVAASTPATAAWPQPTRRREFKSTAEEAQDIISRWQQMQDGSAADS